MFAELNKKLVCVLLIVFAIGVAGCEQEGSMEKAGKAVDEAVEDAAKAVDDVKKDVEESMQEEKENKDS